MDAATALPRVKKFLGPRFRFIKDLFLKHVVDPRDNRGKRRDHLALLHAIFAAFLAGCRTPRQAEKLSEYLYIPDRLRWGGSPDVFPIPRCAILLFSFTGGSLPRCWSSRSGQ